jgi:stress-induced morphogen
MRRALLRCTRALSPVPLAASTLHLRLSPPRSTWAVAFCLKASVRSMSSAAASQPPPGPMQRTIESKLTTAFAPPVLLIQNESHMHSVPPGSESHFRVTVVSEKFEGMPILARHRAVNTALALELKSGIHALSITARTPQQWAIDSAVGKSPPCLGGSKHEQRAKEGVQ